MRKSTPTTLTCDILTDITTVYVSIIPQLELPLNKQGAQTIRESRVETLALISFIHSDEITNFSWINK